MSEHVTDKPLVQADQLPVLGQDLGGGGDGTGDGGDGNGVPRAEYDLSPEELTQLETQLWEEVRSQVEASEHDGIAIVAVPWNSRFAAFGRTTERQHYESEDYDLHLGMIPYEERSLFLYTLDTDTGAIGHVKRVVFARSPEEIAETGQTGLEIVDDRINSEGDEHADLQEIMDYHGIKDIGTCLNVASNHKVVGPNTSKGKPYTEASYKAVFEITREYGLHAVVAYLNNDAIRSFGSFGLEYELLAGREFHVPNNAYDPTDPSSEQFETKFTAVFIPESPANVALFQGLGELVPATNAPIITVD